MGAYEEALQGLNEAQRLAVTTIEGPVLVLAGPGTGKTELLTTRIAHILATTDTLPQNILCLTFTESAAQTMRERLANMIGKAAYDVTISTYHAFGSDLIRRFPDYFASDADMEPIDDLGIDGIFREIIAGLPYNNPLRYVDMYLGDIKTLVSDAKRALLTPEDLRRVARDNEAFIDQASPIVRETLGDIFRLAKKDIPRFEELLAKLQANVTAEKTERLGVILPLATLLLQDLQEAVEMASETNKATPLTKWKNTWLAKDNAGHFVVDGRRTNQKLLAVADVYEQYLQALQARKQFDYDDMILRAVKALQTNNDLRYTLQEQYLYMLLDEFQDTNGAQLKIVELLTDNPASEGRPNVLAVGDDDQAIYAFQGANYSHMLQFYEMYHDVLPVPLTKNYRSQGDILQTARGIAEQIKERLHHHFPQIDKTLTAANSQLPPAVVERREAQSDIMQFAWVGHKIQELIAGGMAPNEIAVLAPQHKYLEPLVPFLQQAGVPVRYEKRENILDDPAINQLLRMTELCLSLTKDDRTVSDALWAEVLSFSFWQLPTSLIWRLSWQSRDEDKPWTDSLLAEPSLRPIALFFVRLSQLAGSETFETMIDYLVGSTPLDLGEPGESAFSSPYYNYYFGVVNGEDSNNVSLFASEQSTRNAAFWQLLNNLIVLRARLKDYKRDSDERLSLQDFVSFVEAHRAADLKILNTSPYASGDKAVQLMTAFKAKGMEFDAVFVLAVNEEAWGNKTRGGGSRIALPANLQFMRYAGATTDERLRLFYVALTRAKTQLYLVNYTATYAGKAMSRLSFLDETTDERYVLQSPHLPEGTQVVQPIEQEAVQPTTELVAYWQQRHEAALSSSDLQTLLKDRLRQYQLSPTHLNDFVDIVNCGPRAFFLRTILRFPQAAPPQVHFGNAVHETLEWIHISTKKHGDRTLPGEAAVLTIFAERLRAKRLSERDTLLFLDRGQAALRTYLEQRRGTISPNDIVEYSFRNEGVFIGKAHLTGKIDKLIVDRQAKTITIIDFKTGKSHNHWSREIKLHKYRQQLYLYRALVEGSHTYAGYRVTDAVLEFVEPDEEGVIQELHVAFDDAEYKRIRRLAEAVWQHIVAVSLPDVQSYAPDLTGIESFENDLIA